MTRYRLLAPVVVILLTASVPEVPAQWPTSDRNRPGTTVGPRRPDQSFEDALRWYQTTTVDAIARFRAQLGRVLPASQWTQEQQIVYDVVLMDDPSIAEATMTDGRKSVRISVGFVRLLEALVEAQAMATAREDPQLAMRYYEYLATTLAANAQAVRAGRTPAAIEVFSRWMGWDPAAAQSQWVGTRAGDLRSLALFTALGFVVAHETAHHVLAHRRYGDKTLAEARADESAADAFALNVLKRLDLQPNAAVPLIAFWGVLGANPAEREARSTHPSSERRMLDITEYAMASVADDPEFQEYLRKNGLVERWRRAQEQTRSVTKDLARAVSAGTADGTALPWGSVKFAPR